MFTNRSSYCLLSEAFSVKKIKPIQMEPEIYKVQPEPVQMPEPVQEIKENFEETCESYDLHCATCSKCKNKRITRNTVSEFLNFALMIFLLWIIIYKPNV